MRDYLPDSVLERIRDRYLAGVADAEAKFQFNAGDEDSLTGALGSAITTPEPVSHIVDGVRYTWQIYYRKLRGRGSGAPEKSLGADGIFQIEIHDQKGRVLKRKGLPFQAKKGWTVRDRSLVHQARKMTDSAGDGLVVDYSARGFTCCSAESVVDVDGQKKDLIDSWRIGSLGQAIGNEFLNCEIGVDGLFFDPDSEMFHIEPPEHAIGTSVEVERFPG
ncbi:MAG: hypothetical protein RL885_16170 [Planctomycetota bacterium]